MHSNNAYLCLVVGLAMTTTSYAIRKGDSQQDVINELGEPVRQVNSGQLTTLTYPKGSVQVRAGKVVSFTPQLSPAGTAAATAPDKEKTKRGGGKVDLEKLLVPGKITIVDFYAEWCGPCKALAPSIEKLVASEPDVYLRKVDIVDWESAVARQHGIRSVPSVRVYGPDGKQVGQGTSAFEAIKAHVEAAKAASRKEST